MDLLIFFLKIIKKEKAFTYAFITYLLILIAILVLNFNKINPWIYTAF